MTSRKTISIVASLAGACFLITGCTTYKDQAITMTKAWHAGQAAVAAKQFGDKADKIGKGDAIIWHLEAATASRACGDFTNSNRHFDAAAAMIDDADQKAKVKVAHEVGATMSNQQNLPYEAKSYDKIMLHTYKAMNYLALADTEKARPEIIRAYQCQQDAVAENARRIEKAKEEADKNKEKEKVDKAQNDPKVSAKLNEVTKGLEGFTFYADYVNPFTVYMDGLFFLYSGSGASDLEHASKSLARVAEYAGTNKFIQQDLQTVTNCLNGQPVAPCTYVIFESGEAASLDQIRIDIPIIVTKVSYVGAAFPKLVTHSGNVSQLSVKASAGEETTLPLASMDSVIALDFKNAFPTIVTKTIISTVAKAVATYTINESAKQAGGDLAGLFAQVGTAIAGAAMNIADTRTWTTLPKEFQVARFSTPADRKLTLSAGNGVPPADISLIDGTVNVVYVKSVAANTPLLVSQFKLK